MATYKYPQLIWHSEESYNKLSDKEKWEIYGLFYLADIRGVRAESILDKKERLKELNRLRKSGKMDEYNDLKKQPATPKSAIKPYKIKNVKKSGKAKTCKK